MVSEILFTLLIVAVGIERLFELKVANRNRAWSIERGGREYSSGHYPFMVVIHTALLFGALAEVWLFNRTTEPALAYSMLLLVICAQGLRWWVIRTLGPMWNTRIIVVPGFRRVDGGPFKYFSHPNYIAVAIEGFALPLVHNAWMTALIFTLCNAGLMWIRITEEEKALSLLKT